MKEIEQLLNQDFIAELTVDESPLVDRWVGECLPIFRIREHLAEELLSGSVVRDGASAIFQNGFKVPGFLVPIMEKWAKEGPIILTSYSHPEQFEMYKFMGSLNLTLFLERIKKEGIVVPTSRVVENWYETVALDRSVKEPLNVANIFPKDKLKVNLLGLSGYQFGSEAIDRDEQLDILKRVDTDEIAQAIVARLTNDLDSELKLSNPNLTKQQRYEMRQVTIKDIISQRLSTIIRLADSSLSETFLRGASRINDFLFELEQRFGSHIFAEQQSYGFSSTMSDLTGIEAKLSSKNTGYFNIIIDTLALLIRAKGVEVLKSLVNSTGEGLFLGKIEGEDLALTVDKETNTFALMNNITGEITRSIEDSKILDFCSQNNFTPLAKPETLALVASGMVFHMGSEHGNRARALSALDLDGVEFRQFSTYASRMRIGQDLEQGNRLFLLGGTKPIPAVLAYVLFGKDFLRAEMMKMVGLRNEPYKLDELEVRHLAAQNLVKSINHERRFLNYRVSHGGYLW